MFFWDLIFFKLLKKKYKEYMSILDWSDIYIFKMCFMCWLMFLCFNCWLWFFFFCFCLDDIVIYFVYILYIDDVIGGVCFVYIILRFILFVKRIGIVILLSEEFVSGWLNYGEIYDGCFN